MPGASGRAVDLGAGVWAKLLEVVAAIPAAVADLRKSRRSMLVGCVEGDGRWSIRSEWLCRKGLFDSLGVVCHPCDQGGGVGGTEAVVDVDDGDVGGAGVEHAEECGCSGEGGSVADRGGDCDDWDADEAADDAREGRLPCRHRR